MVKKTLNRSQLKKKIDVNISLIIRNRDKKCLLDMGAAEVKELDHHHWIHSRANMKYRWDLRNGLSFKKGNHRFKMHSDSKVTADTCFEIAKKNAIAEGILTEKEFDEIYNDREGIQASYKHELFELREILEKTNDFVKRNNLR